MVKQAENKENQTQKKVDSTPEIKNLSISKIEEQANRANQMEYFDLNETERIGYYPIFSQSKIDEMLQELSHAMDQATAMDFTMSDELTMNHVLFLTIKHFTHLKDELSSNLGEQLQQLDWLIDTGLFTKIINDIFLPTELAKIVDSLGDVVGTDLFIKQIERKAGNTLHELEVKNADMMDIFDSKEVQRMKELYQDDSDNTTH